jgi:TRAP-type C4-dicarboxylate transport system substrate-binding protein
MFGIPYAFKSAKQGFAAWKGELGALVRRETEAKGLYVFPTMYDDGMRDIVTNTRPIQAPQDLSGLKVRTAPTPIFVEFFKAFGASPISLSYGDTYPALQTHLVDGADCPLNAIEQARWAEVSRYLSLMNFSWTNLFLFAPMQAMNALPSDIRASLERNARKHAMLQWREQANQDASLVDKLHREGLAVNNVDVEPFRRQLSSLYRSYKTEFGSAWDVLEQYTGKLV